MKASKLLKQARARAGLSQRELSRRSRIPQPMISAIERGLQGPRHETLERLLRACGQELDLIFRGGDGVDRTQFATTLRLTPRQRLELAAVANRNIEDLMRRARIVP